MKYPECTAFLFGVMLELGVSIGMPLSVNGIFPSLAMTADSTPTRSECGIGALMPWNEKLYAVTYLSVPGAGNGTGLYAIDSDMNMQTLADHNSVYANRMIHPPSQQIIIGPYAINHKGEVHTFTSLLKVRIGGMAEHIEDPNNKVYMLGMDGPLWECNVNNYTCTQLFDLVKELEIPKSQQPHFKAAHMMDGILWVASNTFDEADFLQTAHGGRLAEWRGGKSKWVILERTEFVEITGRHNFGRVVYALGLDSASVILKIRDLGDGKAPSHNNSWQTYRLPRASHAYDHFWETEWPRIREVETERYLMDAYGMFYELAPLGWAGAMWGIRPVSQHLRMIPDFTSWRGFLVLGGNQVSSIFDNNWVTGQSQSGLWFGKTDDLWNFGKPKGWGGPWRDSNITNNVPSDPYLMTGFDHKIVHIRIHSRSGKESKSSLAIEIDFTGTAGHMDEPWNVYQKIDIDISSAGGYAYHVFPEGFSAHWVRFIFETPCVDCVATIELHYT